MEVLYEGKAKIVYKTEDPDKLIIYFKDSATAFDAQKRANIEGKGIINNAISSFLFELLEREGIKTHYIKRLSDREMLVWRAKRYELEVVVRNVSAGSMCKRLGLKEGERLKKPLVEYFYKRDDLRDPLMCQEHIILLGLVPEDKLKLVKDIALRVNEILYNFFDNRGLLLVDFKLELGELPDGSVGVVDEISPDTMRLWDKTTGEKLDKDRFRFDLGDLLEGYKKVLERLYL